MNKFKENYLKTDNFNVDSIYRIFDDIACKFDEEVNYNHVNLFVRFRSMNIIYNSILRIQTQNANNLRLNGG